jgi:hypothetical protein
VHLIKKHNVERAFFTGHSLGGGIAHVAHLVVRAQLKKTGSPWAELDGTVNWLACTFAAPPTIVRKYDPSLTPPLILDLDAFAYNIVYGCDPVPRPGMLAYIGNFLEIVVRKIREDIEGIVKKHPKLGFLKLLRLLVLPNLLEDGAVKNLKETGIAGIVNNLTHVGTVVYQKSEYGSGEDKKYMYLTPEAKIRSVLDVKDKKEFRELWGIKAFGKTTQPLVHTLLEAHLHVYKFKFGPQP